MSGVRVNIPALRATIAARGVEGLRGAWVPCGELLALVEAVEAAREAHEAATTPPRDGTYATWQRAPYAVIAPLERVLAVFVFEETDA